jgi:hypothetical protein
MKSRRPGGAVEPCERIATAVALGTLNSRSGRDAMLETPVHRASDFLDLIGRQVLEPDEQKSPVGTSREKGR